MFSKISIAFLLASIPSALSAQINCNQGYIINPASVIGTPSTVASIYFGDSETFVCYNKTVLCGGLDYQYCSADQIANQVPITYYDAFNQYQNISCAVVQGGLIVNQGRQVNVSCCQTNNCNFNPSIAFAPKANDKSGAVQVVMGTLAASVLVMFTLF